MGTHLKRESIMRAIAHISLYGDTDLFPQLKEFEILFNDKDKLTDELVDIDLENYIWQPYRRFIIPKDDVSYRVSIQLDPIDSILFEAIAFEYGSLIEMKRVSQAERIVFSNRFDPNDVGQLYNKKDSWKNYWTTIEHKANFYPYAVYIDIADFYNRIYHHTLENQMTECNFPNQIMKAIKKLIQSTTQTVSQGIPVGPHASHILAEMYLIPLDEGLKLKGYDFCRYVDDIFIFAQNEMQAKLIIYEMAKMIDSLKLTMQRQKTKIFNAEELHLHCERMKDDDPINDLEKNIIGVVDKYLANDPYQLIDFKELSELEKMVFSEENIESLINEYINEHTGYQRIRWLYKRLAKVGVDTALKCTLNNINSLMPVMNDIALYFASVAYISERTLSDIGLELLHLLDHEIIKSNEFFQLTILNLFTESNRFNNIASLLRIYSGANDHAKREIILAAHTSNAVSWIREIKHEYNNLGIWSKRALVIASSILPRDERKYFLNSLTDTSNFCQNYLKKYCRDL